MLESKKILVVDLNSGNEYTFVGSDPVTCLIDTYYQVVKKNFNTWTYDYEKIKRIVEYTKSGKHAMIEHNPYFLSVAV